MLHLTSRSVLSYLAFLFISATVVIVITLPAEAETDPLPYSYRLTYDTHPNSAISAYADASGLSVITYFHEAPSGNGYVDYYVAWIASNTGIERGLGNATTLTGNPFSDSGILYSPTTGNVQAVYIVNNIIMRASGCDGNTTWGQDNITGTYGAIDLDYVLNGDYGEVAFSGNMDNDSEKEVLLVASVNTYGQGYGTPVIVVDGYSDGTGSHSYDHVQLAMDSSGKYHLAYLEEWVKAGSDPPVRRIVYKTNAGAGLTLTSPEYDWNESLTFGRKGIALFGSTPYITYSQNNTVYVASISGGVWTPSASFAGSQPSIGATSSRVDIAYRDGSGQIAFIEDNGTGWKTPWIVDTAAHDPAIAVAGTSTFVYYLRTTRTGEDPQTTNDEVFCKSNTEIHDSIAPYVRLIWPATDGWASANTAFYGQDQEMPRLKEECSVDGVHFYDCDFTASQTKLGDIPEFASIPNNGSFTAWIQDTDAAGNIGKSSQPLVRKDALAPTTSDDYETEEHVSKSGLWQTDNQTITLTPSDPGAPGTGSGLDCSIYSMPVNCTAWTKYCIGASCQIDDEHGSVYQNPVTISDEGTTVFRYASRDVAGNIQSPVTLTVMIDKTGPEVNVGADLLLNGTVNINATATDTASGIASYLWTKGSGPGNVTFGSASSEDTTVEMSVDGTYILRLTVTDTAGNSRHDEVTVMWDVVVPDTANDYDDTRNDILQSSNQTITLTPSDPAPSSGIHWTKYCLAATSGGCDIHESFGEMYSVPVVISNEGTTYFRYRSKDMAGNFQAIIERIVKINKPTTTTSSNSTTTSKAATTTTTAGGGGGGGGGGGATTTTLSSTTTTSTESTTTTTTGLCPSQKTLGEDSPDLENLRAFRDGPLARSAVGRRIIEIYYSNAGSINEALDRSPPLRNVTRRVLEIIAAFASEIKQ